MKSESNLRSRYFTQVKTFSKIPVIKTYGSTIFTLLVMTIFIFFAIKPTVETILVLQKKLADSDIVLKKVKEKADNLSQAVENYNNLDDTTKSRIQAIIPDSVNLRSLISVLEGAAQTHEASISALQVQPLVIDIKEGVNLGALTELEFTFNIEGNYPNLINVLQDLRNSSRLISVERVSLNKANEGGGLIMSLSGKAYYMK